MPTKKPAPVNDEFGLADVTATAEEAAAAAAFDAELGQIAKHKKAKQKAKFIDPEDDRKNWPTIRIEDVAGLSNYEFVSVSGTKKNGKPFDHEFRIKRNEDVQVPPSIINTLRDAVTTKYTQRKNRETDRNELVPHESSSVPWHMVKGGKYF